jgi:hypothetical protein
MSHDATERGAAMSTASAMSVVNTLPLPWCGCGSVCVYGVCVLVHCSPQLQKLRCSSSILCVTPM